MGLTVLVVEDERRIRDLLRGYLEREGYAVVSTGSGAEALVLAERAQPDLVLLDLRLPDVPGEEVARELRARAATPVIILTAKSTQDERERGLELGADDYVTKPFSPRELMLRVRAVLRRSQGGLPPAGTESFGGGEVVIDPARHELRVRGELVELTPTEWNLLATLSDTTGRVFSRYELINRVRGYEFEGYERIIDSHVKNLRRKLEADPHNPRLVQTVLGVGYRFGIPRDPLALLAGTALELFEPLAQEGEVTLEGVLEPVVVDGDETRLHQVAVNLIANAVKYSPQGRGCGSASGGTASTPA